MSASPSICTGIAASGTLYYYNVDKIILRGVNQIDVFGEVAATILPSATNVSSLSVLGQSVLALDFSPSN